MKQTSYTATFLVDLLNIPSPTGYTDTAIRFLREEAEKMGYRTEVSPKGNLRIFVEGMDALKTIGFCAHTDTLGLMVRSIKGNGNLAFTLVGGPQMATLDGEYCTIHTRQGKTYTGTILSNSPASHVFKDAGSSVRSEETMEIRLDEVVTCKADTEKLGIANGDFIAIDTKTQVTSSGFVKSRFLDDKASVAVLMGVLNELSATKTKPKYNTEIILTVYEETGHGNSWVNPDITEMIAVDMGCIGLDLACSERDVSICAKDSSGPYDYAMTTHLSNLAKQENIRAVVDIYPFYGSDVSAALRGGNNLRGALIGPGVGASHGMERTHLDALQATHDLVLAYMKQPA
ncbi:MAG TPA: aminopeptidase [Erysipelotrichaceae bacterium]|nr:MAG: aminopeptidase [Firmicutes bacterium GWE2_51_13]HAM64218.1 aminopeptidase [Erysipelotrichaceae bacterium]HAO62174.1 aminopeptidase [Erysipelotrichaceae bacterium]HBZ42282.1 aminopeptidase [Erysipelotrichaceae bacterium]